MRLRGLGLARRLSSHRPHGLGWLMGAREGGKEGRTWWGDPIVSCRLYLAAWKALGRERQGAGGRGRRRPRVAQSGRHRARRNRGKALVGGKEPRYPTPQPALLPPQGLAKFPNLLEGLGFEAENQRRAELSSTVLPHRPHSSDEKRGSERGTGLLEDTQL